MDVKLMKYLKKLKADGNNLDKMFLDLSDFIGIQPFYIDTILTYHEYHYIIPRIFNSFYRYTIDTDNDDDNDGDEHKIPYFEMTQNLVTHIKNHFEELGIILLGSGNRPITINDVYNFTVKVERMYDAEIDFYEKLKKTKGPIKYRLSWK